MTATIIDGKAIAEKVRLAAGEEVAAMLAAGKPKPGLATVLVGDNPASQVYVSSKQKACAQIGMESYGFKLPATATQDEVEGLVIRQLATGGGDEMERNPDNEAVPGVLAFRVETSLVYFNLEHVREAVLERIRSVGDPPKLVIGDLSTSPYVDLAGARMLAALHAQLAEAGVTLRLAAAHAAVRDLLRAEGIEERVGYFGRRISVADVVDEFEGGAGA